MKQFEINFREGDLVRIQCEKKDGQKSVVFGCVTGVRCTLLDGISYSVVATHYKADGSVDSWHWFGASAENVTRPKSEAEWDNARQSSIDWLGHEIGSLRDRIAAVNAGKPIHKSDEGRVSEYERQIEIFNDLQGEIIGLLF